MMQIVERSPVVVDKAEWIPGENIAAVVADSFDCGE